MTYYRVEHMIAPGTWVPAWFADTSAEAIEIVEKQRIRTTKPFRIQKVSDDVFDGTNRLKVKEVKCD